MKTLVVAPTPFFSNRGTHIRILEEALALEKMGHDITIATYHIGQDIDRQFNTHIDVRRIRRWLFWYKKIEAGPDWQKIFLDLMLIRKVFNLARKKHPQIIHGHLHEGVLIGWVVKYCLFWRKIKLVADLHGSLTNEMISHNYLSGGWLKKIFRYLENFINNLGDAIITSSDENTGQIRKMLPQRKVTTVLDGVNMDYYSASSDKDGLRSALMFPDDKIIATYTGALIFNKGVDYLWGAIRKVIESRQDIYFVIAGFPPEKARTFIDKYAYQENVRLISPLAYRELPSILRASDIGIDPKDSGTLQASGKILQYMGAGLPIVCFDRTNNRQYLGDLGCYASEISDRGLAREIERVADNLAFHQRNSLEIMKMAEKYSWSASAEKIDAVYHDLLVR